MVMDVRNGEDGWHAWTSAPPPHNKNRTVFPGLSPALLSGSASVQDLL